MLDYDLGSECSAKKSNVRNKDFQIGENIGTRFITQDQTKEYFNSCIKVYARLMVGLPN